MESTLRAEATRRSAGGGDALARTLAEAAAGDEGALARLFDATSAQVFGWTLRILHDRAAAEEATLDVFAQVWRQAGTYDPQRGSVAGWILTLARSRAIDLLRSRNRTLSREEAVEGLEALPDPENDPASASVEAERAGRVRRALLALAPEQRRVLEAAFFGGMSHSEVADALGLPLGTVKTRIRAGLASLRRALAGMEVSWA